MLEVGYRGGCKVSCEWLVGEVWEGHRISQVSDYVSLLLEYNISRRYHRRKVGCNVYVGNISLIKAPSTVSIKPPSDVP